MKRFLENLYEGFVGLAFILIATGFWFLSIFAVSGFKGDIQDWLGSEQLGSIDLFDLPIWVLLFISWVWMFFILVWWLFVDSKMLPIALGFVVGWFERFLDWISEDWEKGKESFQETRAEVKEGKTKWQHWIALFTVLLWVGIFVWRI